MPGFGREQPGRRGWVEREASDCPRLEKRFLGLPSAWLSPGATSAQLQLLHGGLCKCTCGAPFLTTSIHPRGRLQLSVAHLTDVPDDSKALQVREPVFYTNLGEDFDFAICLGISKLLGVAGLDTESHFL